MRRNVAAGLTIVATVGIAWTPSADAERSAMTVLQQTCTWTRTDLPAPKGAKSFRVSAQFSSALIAGRYVVADDIQQGVIWANGQVQLMPVMPGRTTNYPTDINESGVVAGFTSTIVDKEVINEPYRLLRSGDKFTYQILPVPAGRRAWAVAINNSGDIVGHTDDWTIILWTAKDPDNYQLIDNRTLSTPVGIDDDRRIFTNNGTILFSDGTVRSVEVPEGFLPETSVADFHRGRIVGTTAALTDGALVQEGAVWDSDGKLLRRIPDAVSVADANLDNTVVGYFFDRTTGSQRVAVSRVDQAPEFLGDADSLTTVLEPMIDNIDVVTANHTVGGVVQGAAQWRCV